MSLRRATSADLPIIMSIVEQCQYLLKERGVDQWQDGYPSQAVIEADIESVRGYTYIYNGEVIAYVALAFGREEAYDYLRGGEWLTCEEDYLTIHRMAVADSCRGQNIANQIFKESLELASAKGYKSVRVDTHADNSVMLRRFVSLGFIYCGVVEYRSSERLAFELKLL